MSGVKDLGLMVLLLEEQVPECTIFGIDSDHALPQSPRLAVTHKCKEGEERWNGQLRSHLQQ